MRQSFNILNGVLAASAFTAQPVAAQTQGPPSLVDTGKPFSLEEKKQPVVSLTTSLGKSKSKNLTLEFGKYGPEMEGNKSGLRWEIAPGMEMKAKYKRIRFTWEF